MGRRSRTYLLAEAAAAPLTNPLRSIYGLFAARRGVVQCATTDWRGEWAKCEDPDKIEFEDVLHVIIIPK